MGTQQSRSGHGRQGSHQPGQQSDHRPQQDRDLQRNKQSDRSQQQHQEGGRGRQQQQAGSASEREAPSTGTRRQQQAGSASEREARSAGMRHQQTQGGASGTSRQQEQQAERQQSELGGRRDFTHRMENEGREQNREQQDVRSQQAQQNAGGPEGQQNAGGQQGRQNVYGEGNYAASRQYDEATKQYVQSGRVEPAARAAAPKSQGEAREMDAAEAEGKRHAKGEDPALNRRASPSSGESSETPRPGHEEE
jgi:hypothetical protein